MARNEEKAMSMFNKWTTFKRESHLGLKKKPFLASECTSLVDAEKFRRDIIRDVNKKIAVIQNAALGEHSIRDTNDQINKLLREKHYWESRIRELGGGDYSKSRTQVFDVEGKELPGYPGYKYFGAAKDLPGVRELFQEHEEAMEERKKKRTRTDLYKNISPDYFGYRDEEDVTLLPKEAEMEKRLVSRALQEYDQKLREKKEELKELGLADASMAEQEEDDDTQDIMSAVLDTSAHSTKFAVRAHVPVPSQDEITGFILERRKRALVDKFVST